MTTGLRGTYSKAKSQGAGKGFRGWGVDSHAPYGAFFNLGFALSDSTTLRLGTGAELSPATDRPDVVHALQELLSLPDVPSAGHVVALDLEAVGVDLRLVPMDEVLDFRKEHFKEHRAYVLSVRSLTRELSQLSEHEREETLEVRREALQEMANRLKTVSSKAWKRSASFGLGMAGAFWKLGTHDYVGALLAAGGALAGIRSKDKVDTGAYSYLFRANSKFPN